MIRAGGYAQITGPGLSGLRDEGLASLHTQGECDTFTCGHCQRVVFVPVRCDPASAGGFCRTCERLICSECAGLGHCFPLEEAIERQLEREHHLRWLRW